MEQNDCGGCFPSLVINESLRLTILSAYLWDAAGSHQTKKGTFRDPWKKNAEEARVRLGLEPAQSPSPDANTC